MIFRSRGTHNRPTSMQQVVESRQGPQSIPKSFDVAAGWAWRFIVMAGATAIALWLVLQFSMLVISLAVALILTSLVNPVVHFLANKLKFPRALAALTTLLLSVALVTGLLVLAGRSISLGIGQLWQRALQGFEELLAWAEQGPLQINAEQLDLMQYVQQMQDFLTNNSGSILSGAMSVTSSVGQFFSGLLIMLFCWFFFMYDGRTIWAWIVRLFPRNGRTQIHESMRRGFMSLAAYSRTQVLVALVDSIGIGIGAAILQVPLALPLAVLVFLGSFIPIVGAIATGAIAVLVALVDQGFTSALIMLGIVLLVQQIEGNVLQPFLMGKMVALHPVAVLLAVTAGTLVAGIIGALFAVPLVAAINSIVLYLHGTDKYPDLGTEPPKGAE